jgi:hypothetical protein
MISDLSYILSDGHLCNTQFHILYNLGIGICFKIQIAYLQPPCSLKLPKV